MLGVSSSIPSELYPFISDKAHLILLMLALVTACREAKIELGEKVASQLKLTKDGSKVLWPQPTDSELRNLHAI